MRAGLSTIQQTLTPEAATVLNQSISEASRRNHGQTTPLHVAATLLSSPSGYLRQVCIRSHPNSSHPLQCRALELCFSVALDRLPTAHNTAAPPIEPPISNALMAALKRAQAHQRRGCPEQQQQPLLAVKVELDQLIISILDDPSVSRVMREARFSSPAVKAAIEQSLISPTPTSHRFGPKMLSSNSGQIITRPLVPLSNHNRYLNPRLHNRGDEVNKVLEIMLRRTKKRNPILVGDSEPKAVVKEVLRRIENGELGSDTIFKNAQIMTMENGLLSSDKNEILLKIKELGGMIERMIESGGVILDLGDLKWLVEQQQRQPLDLEMGRAAVVEMAKLLARFRGDGGGGGGDGGDEDCKVWCIGTATCETYLRCQVYHSTMENDWDLQALPIASRSPLPGMFPRVGTERILSKPGEPLNPMKSFPTPLSALTSRVSENSDNIQRTVFCAQCSQNYENELAKLTEIQQEPSLPQWLQNAKIADQSQGQNVLSKHKTQELEKKWRETCLHVHQNIRTEYANLLKNPIFHHNLQTNKTLGEPLHLNPNPVTNTPPSSPVRTDLVLGRNGIEDHSEDFFDKFSNASDVDAYKKLLKSLVEKTWWQTEAASAVASAITRCRLGNGKKHRESRADIWLLFAGPDRIAKKKMAFVLAEQICGARPIVICLGDRRDEDEESNLSFRGKTAIDRITEAVRRNPFSVIVLEDVDVADMVVRGNVKRAIERGRLEDSHGREVSLGNAIFILAGNWSRNDREAYRDFRFVDEGASGNWQLGLIVREKSAKRRKELDYGLSLDLNLATDGSHDSSDVTVDHEDEVSPITYLPHDLLDSVDESIVFKPVDYAFVRREIKETISMKFSKMVDDDVAVEVEDDVIEKILGGLWHDKEWVEKSLGPRLDRLKQQFPVRSSDRNSSVVRLVVESCLDKSNGNGDWLPSRILV